MDNIYFYIEGFFLSQGINMEDYNSGEHVRKVTEHYLIEEMGRQRYTPEQVEKGVHDIVDGLVKSMLEVTKSPVHDIEFRAIEHARQNGCGSYPVNLIRKLFKPVYWEMVLKDGAVIDFVPANFPHEKCKYHARSEAFAKKDVEGIVERTINEYRDTLNSNYVGVSTQLEYNILVQPKSQ